MVTMRQNITPQLTTLITLSTLSANKFPPTVKSLCDVGGILIAQ